MKASLEKRKKFCSRQVKSNYLLIVKKSYYIVNSSYKKDID